MRHLHRRDAVADAEPGPTPDPRESRRALLRTTWSLAWPVIFSFSIESIVGVADMLMVGRLGRDAVAGVGVGVQILGAANFALIAVGTGALAIVARHVGAREMGKAEDAVQQSVLAAVVLGVLVAVPVIVFAPEIIAVFHVEPNVVVAGTPFVRRVMLAVPAEAVFFVVASGLRGAGDTRTPLVIGMITAALAVSAAWVLIFGHFGFPALGVVGAATATGIGFTAGAVIGLVLLARGQLVLRSHWRPFVVRRDMIRRVLNVGYPAAIEHLLVQLGFFAYVFFVAHHGTAPVAAYFIGVRILALSFLPGFGFAAAAGTMVGQSLGAGRPSEAERSGWAALELATCMMSAAGVVIYFAARPIARLFVDDLAVVESAVGFIRVLALAQPLMALDFTLGGALRGAGDTRFPLLTALLGIYGCRLGVAYLATFVLDASLVWLWTAIIVDYVARSGAKAWRFRSGRWKYIRV